MKKPVVDYRELRLNNITSPRYSHLLLLLGWLVYFIFYFITENLIPAEVCHPMHCFIDDIVPFNEYFFIFYCSWFVVIAVSLVYFLLYNVDNFRNLQTYIIITQVVAMLVYIIYPSRQDLRPLVFERDNFFTHVASFIYAFDTNTGVCPSLHVAYSLGMISCWLRERSAHPAVKVLLTVLLLLICVSVMFVKQHSAVDVMAAIPVGLLAEWLVFGKSSPLKKIRIRNGR